MSSNMSAIELLKLGDNDRTKPFLTTYGPHILGTFFGIGSAAAINFGTRRPLLSGLQKHVIGVAGWVALLSFIQKKRYDYLAEKNAVLLHYIELHPEDFPIPERKKIGDILEPWIPVR